MSFFRKIAWAVILLQLVTSRGKTVVAAVAPSPCSAMHQNSADVRINPISPLTHEHMSVQLKCIAPSDLEPKFKWFRNGNATNYSTHSTNDIEVGAMVSLIEIKPTREDNGAEFYCSVWSEKQQKEFNTCYVTLSVTFPPKIAMSTYPEKLEIGAPGRIECLVEANPPPSYIYLIGNEVNVTDFVYDNETERYRISANFSTISQRDTGVYTCIAYNGFKGLVQLNSSIEAFQSVQSSSTTFAYTFVGIESAILVFIIIVVFIYLYRRSQSSPEVKFVDHESYTKQQEKITNGNDAGNQIRERPHTSVEDGTYTGEHTGSSNSQYGYPQDGNPNCPSYVCGPSVAV